MTDTKEFRSGMALLGSAVCVITSDGPEERVGFTASAVCSVTDSPPTLLVCMNSASELAPKVRANGVLCVNVLSADQEEASRAFATRGLSREQRFARASWSTLATGAPVLDGALASFDCSIVQTQNVGTHHIFYCEIKAVRYDDSRDGLAYFKRAYHRLGTNVGGQCLQAEAAR
ncbi:flavin reductase [Alcaligenaceae bacterium CGII-47]|nr:flavin reductase [Alcaligenaceae bacterium CGII-47]